MLRLLSNLYFWDSLLLIGQNNRPETLRDIPFPDDKYTPPSPASTWKLGIWTRIFVLIHQCFSYRATSLPSRRGIMTQLRRKRRTNLNLPSLASPGINPWEGCNLLALKFPRVTLLGIACALPLWFFFKLIVTLKMGQISGQRSGLEAAKLN